MAETAQARRHAADARRTMDERRRKQTGAAGDAWTVGVQWWRRFGDERPLHGTAHDALMALPLVVDYFRRMGVLPAARDSMRTAFQEPVRLSRDPERASDDAYVEPKYEEVRERIQHGMDALARRRTLPLFG
jgi:hypothetical protein